MPDPSASQSLLDQSLNASVSTLENEQQQGLRSRMGENNCCRCLANRHSILRQRLFSPRPGTSERRVEGDARLLPVPRLAMRKKCTSASASLQLSSSCVFPGRSHRTIGLFAGGVGPSGRQSFFLLPACGSYRSHARESPHRLLSHEGGDPSQRLAAAQGVYRTATTNSPAFPLRKPSSLRGPA